MKTLLLSLVAFSFIFANLIHSEENMKENVLR